LQCSHCHTLSYHEGGIRHEVIRDQEKCNRWKNKHDGKIEEYLSMANSEDSTKHETQFANPFHIEDIAVFDDSMLKRILVEEAFGVTLMQLACGLHGESRALTRRIEGLLPIEKRWRFMHELRKMRAPAEVMRARKKILDALFWELTYWKTPELYEELTEGEQIHADIFRRLEPDLRGRIVLDAGAGSGRASFACLRHGASIVYAVEPSPGLRRILERKLEQQPATGRLELCSGRFDAIPLADNSVDIALSCSAFTSASEQGGDAGLAELRRVVCPGGKIVLIWPRVEDRSWLERHGFRYISLPCQGEMNVIRFSSLHSALLCARRFYARNRAVIRYLLTRQRPELPFSLLGMHPPCDYCWLEVDE
jgi:ubiquinone/menaquinone biosynthesis C-methylase UbiE